MIGPGTGIAPFRSPLCNSARRKVEGKNWLFFSSPHFTEDFLYQVEWQLREEGESPYRLSRSRSKEKNLRTRQAACEQGAELWRWINDGAHIYVCGDAGAWPQISLLLEVIAEFGGMDLNRQMNI